MTNSRVPFAIHFSSRLNLFLQESKCTHRKLSQLTKIPLTTIDGYCVGSSIPSFYNVWKIAEALHISVSDFVYGYKE